MQTKCYSFFILCSFKFREKKTHASAICKRFLFPKSNDPPKITTPLKLLPPKAANSESNEGRYYRNSTVLYKAKYYLPSNSLLTLYYALIYPYLNLLQFNLGLYLCHQPTTNLPTTEKSPPGDL